MSKAVRRLFAASLILVGASALAGCTSTGFKNAHLSERTCLAHARQTLYDADFSENLLVAPERSAVLGRHGGYDAAIYCDGYDRGVRFEVHGLDPDQADWYRSVIVGKF
jgi:hypothetical protein